MSTAAPNECLLEARGVTRRFGGLVAVDAVDLAVRRGSVHGLIGPNGAGKTTLLNLIAGVHRVGSGLLRFAAQDITRDSTAKRARAGIRRTFQNLKLFGEMTALENAAIGLHAQTHGGFFDAVFSTPRHRLDPGSSPPRASSRRYAIAKPPTGCGWHIRQSAMDHRS